jgi:hypothetical protein
LLLIAVPACATQPTLIEWSEVRAHGDGVEVLARRSSDTLASLVVITRWGRASLKTADRIRLGSPDLGSLRVVKFPLNMEFSNYEFHVYLNFRDSDFNERREACWKQPDMTLEDDLAMLTVDRHGVRELTMERSECERMSTSGG